MKNYILLASVFFMTTVSAQSSFSDVSENHTYQQALENLKEEGVITGYADGTYKTNNRINRAEFVTLLMRASGKDLKGEGCFDDVEDEWFAASVCTAKERGVIDGYEDGFFRPNQYINLAEASKIIANTLRSEDISTTSTSEDWPAGRSIESDWPAGRSFSEDWFAPFLEVLEKEKALPLSVFSPEQWLNRGEMAEMVWRLREEVQNKPSQKASTLTQDLPKFESCDAFSGMIEEQANNQMYHYALPMMMRTGAVMEMESMADDSAAAVSNVSGAAPSDGSYSETNVQVKGVDEADIVKTDGQYIYYVKNQEFFIVQARPANELKVLYKQKLEKMNAQEILLNGNQLIVLGQESYDYPSIQSYPQEPEILEEETGSLFEQFLYSVFPKASALRMAPPYYDYHYKPRTKVVVFDITNKEAPKEVKEFSFDGNYQTVRRVGDALYIVLNHSGWGLVQPLDLLPTYRVDGEEKALVGCEEARYIPGYYPQQWTAFLGINLSDLDAEPDKEVIVGGSSSTVYSSKDNLYVTTPYYDTSRYTDWNWEVDRTQTAIFKFSLDNGNVAFEKKGKVPGSLLNQFSLDEEEDYLRVATTTRGQIMANQLYVLNKNLEQVGSIEDIAPGEQIYSTRFIGNRLYMVTFKTIDPLFVIDLTVPEKPTILGKLKIPGFSNYLHPFDEDHLIGFGKDTQESKDQTIAWQQGMKLALFDVSDVNNPIQEQELIIGDRGTDSELLQNHKALMWDPVRKNIGFPIQVAKIQGEKNEWEEENSRYGTTEFVGAHVYNVSEENGFTLLATPTHYEDEDILKMGDYWPHDWQKNIQRILYIGDDLYTVSPEKIKITDLLTGDEGNEVEFQ